jgi:beta-phosphoglucomutase-like phosphatase (HAD superfamily)
MHMIEALIFDVDGTLAETEQLHRRAFNESFAACDEVRANKPAAEVYQLALWRLGIAPHRAVAFEDFRNGLHAAKSAGIACIVVPGEYSLGDDFAGADLVVPEFSDLCGACCVFEAMRHDGAHLRP